MDIDPVKEQFGDDGIGIPVSGINIQYFKFQRPIGFRSIMEAQYADVKRLEPAGILQLQNGIGLPVVLHP